MKILKIKVDGLKLFNDVLEIDFMAKQKIMSSDDENVFKIFESSKATGWTNNILSFIGINASGKTTTLKIVSFVLQLLEGEPINRIKYNDILNYMDNEKGVNFEIYFMADEYTKNKRNKMAHGLDIAENDKNYSLYKLSTTINKGKGDKEKFIISKENILMKSIKSIKNKKNIFEFEKAEEIIVRTGNEEFLLDDVSTIVSINKWIGTKVFYRDLVYLTNINVIEKLPKELPTPFISFLDQSIEYLKTNELSNHKTDIRLKFKGDKEIILDSTELLDQYLSSGTIKGINVFLNMLEVLKKGGYLLVDELENHFNKEIVSTIIRIFTDKELNSKGATLVFTTHYAEILDKIERNDSICIVRNNNGIKVDNLSELLNRNDLKKSEVYSSDFLGGTAPSYETYMDVKKVIRSEVSIVD